MFQVNILVDKNGTAWIAGLGNVSTLPHPTTRTVEGRTTKARDIYAFGVMAYEVKMDLFVQHYNHSLETGFHGRDGSKSFDGGWAHTVAARPP